MQPFAFYFGLLQLYTDRMAHLSVSEMRLCMDSVYGSLFGHELYTKWKHIKEKFQFTSEESFVGWMLNYVEVTLLMANTGGISQPSESFLKASNDTVLFDTIMSETMKQPGSSTSAAPETSSQYPTTAVASGKLRVKKQRKWKPHVSQEKTAPSPSKGLTIKKNLSQKPQKSSQRWSDILVSIAKSTSKSNSGLSLKRVADKASNKPRPHRQLLLQDVLKTSQELGPASGLLISLGAQERREHSSESQETASNGSRACELLKQRSTKTIKHSQIKSNRSELCSAMPEKSDINVPARSLEEQPKRYSAIIKQETEEAEETHSPALSEEQSEFSEDAARKS